MAQDEDEKRILATLKEMLEGERFRNVSPTDGRLLRLLAEAVDAKRVVEIGTSTGESAVWLALAVESTGGHVYTHEIDDDRANIAVENFKKAGGDKLVTKVPGDADQTVKRIWIPMIRYSSTRTKLMPLIRPGGLIVAHNMNTRQADARFVKAITENPQLETLILLKEGTGVGVTLKRR